MVGKKQGLVPSRDFTSVPRSRVRAAYALELAVRTRWSLVCTSEEEASSRLKRLYGTHQASVLSSTEADLINDK